MITSANIRIHELIGLKARVAQSLSQPYQGISGTVVDETKNTLVLLTRKGEKTVPKKGSVFSFHLPSGQEAKVDGSGIAFRPYDRPKKCK